VLINDAGVDTDDDMVESRIPESFAEKHGLI